MLNTPIGMRYPEDGEYQMVCCGANRLAAHLISRLRSEEKKIAHEGVILKPIKEENAFQALPLKSQLITLSETISKFLSAAEQYPMDRLANGALEAVYSCLFHEVRMEVGKALVRRGVRQIVHNAWEYWYDGKGPPITANTDDLNLWISVIDKLATRSVYDANYAKAFDAGQIAEVNDLKLQSSCHYLETLA